MQFGPGRNKESVDQDKAHMDAGTHPGDGWSWWTNTTEPHRYKGADLTIVHRAFNGDGTVYGAGSAIFENEAHKEKRLDDASRGIHPKS